MQYTIIMYPALCYILCKHLSHLILSMSTLWLLSLPFYGKKNLRQSMIVSLVQGLTASKRRNLILNLIWLILESTLLITRIICLCVSMHMLWGLQINRGDLLYSIFMHVIFILYTIFFPQATFNLIFFPDEELANAIYFSLRKRALTKR